MQGSKNIKSENKPLSSRAIDAMKPGNKIKADTGENSGLRVKCGKTLLGISASSKICKRGHFLRSRPWINVTEGKQPPHSDIWGIGQF